MLLKEIVDLEITTEANKHACHTRLAVALLRHHLAERREAWALADEKAPLWLSNLTKVTRWEEFISQILTQV